MMSDVPFFTLVRLAGLGEAFKSHPRVLNTLLDHYCGVGDDDFGHGLDETAEMLNKRWPPPAGYEWVMTKWVVYLQSELELLGTDLGHYDYFADMQARSV